MHDNVTSMPVIIQVWLFWSTLANLAECSVWCHY